MDDGSINGYWPCLLIYQIQRQWDKQQTGTSIVCPANECQEISHWQQCKTGWWIRWMLDSCQYCHVFCFPRGNSRFIFCEINWQIQIVLRCFIGFLKPFGFFFEISPFQIRFKIWVTTLCGIWESRMTDSIHKIYCLIHKQSWFTSSVPWERICLIIWLSTAEIATVEAVSASRTHAAWKMEFQTLWKFWHFNIYFHPDMRQKRPHKPESCQTMSRHINGPFCQHLVCNDSDKLMLEGRYRNLNIKNIPEETDKLLTHTSK